MKILFTIALAILLTGCSSNNFPPGPESAIVVMHTHSFDPATVTIQSGQTVRWENKSVLWHTVTDKPNAAKDPSHVALPKGAESFDSGRVHAGKSYWQTFTVPGAYKCICRPHESNGMLGTIIVQPPGHS